MMGTFNVETYDWRDTIVKSSWPPFTQELRNPFSIFRITRIGVTTPGYKLLKMNHLPLPENDYSFTSDYYTGNFGSSWASGTLDDPGYFQYTTGVLSPVGVDMVPLKEVPGDMPTQIYARCVNKALAEVKSQSVNIIASIGDGRQTLDMVTSVIRTLTSVVVNLKHFDLPAAARALGKVYHGNHSKSRTIHDSWLELSYGWKPLLSDVYGVLEQIEKSNKNIPLISGKGYYRHEETESPTYQTNTENIQTDMSVLMTGRMKLYYKVVDRDLKSLSEWGITNPSSVAWELLPFSFVADWFIPIGNYINALDADFGLQFVRGSYAVVKKQYTVRRYRSETVLWGTVRGTQWSSSRTLKTYNRVGLTTSPQPVFPSFKNPIGVAHFLNALALLRGRIK